MWKARCALVVLILVALPAAMSGFGLARVAVALALGGFVVLRPRPPHA